MALCLCICHMEWAQARLRRAPICMAGVGRQEAAHRDEHGLRSTPAAYARSICQAPVQRPCSSCAVAAQHPRSICAQHLPSTRAAPVQ